MPRYNVFVTVKLVADLEINAIDVDQAKQFVVDDCANYIRDVIEENKFSYEVTDIVVTEALKR